MAPRTVRAFVGFSLGLVAVFWLVGWVGSQPKVAGLPWPLRWVLENVNGPVAAALTSSRHRSAEFAPAQAQRPRVNGLIGMRGSTPDAATYSFEVIDLDSTRRFRVGLADLRALPRTEVTYDFKCIEGWSQLTNWGGVRLTDFIRAHHLGRHPDGTPARWVALSTPDGKYYVGLDWASAVHPQTLLCDQSQHRALRPMDGAPLRLIIPVKYGIKHLKRIGTIRFTDQRPPDYWYERGYDYHAGL